MIYSLFKNLEKKMSTGSINNHWTDQNLPTEITHCHKSRKSTNDSLNRPAPVHASYRTRQSAPGTNPLAPVDDQAEYLCQNL